MIKSLVLIFLGGGLGSVLRFGIADTLNNTYPYGTMLANIIGSLLIGLCLAMFEKQIFGQASLLLFAVGFCGGFTTFSSFAAENLRLLEAGEWINFLLYSLGSVLLGILMVWVGFRIVKLF